MFALAVLIVSSVSPFPLLNDYLKDLPINARSNDNISPDSLQLDTNTGVRDTVSFADQSLQLHGLNTPKLFSVLPEGGLFFSLKNSTLGLSSLDLVGIPGNEVMAAADSKIELRSILFSGTFASASAFSLSNTDLVGEMVAIRDLTMASLIDKRHVESTVTLAHSQLQDVIHGSDSPFVFSGKVRIADSSILNVTTPVRTTENAVPESLLRPLSCELANNAFVDADNAFYGGIVAGVEAYFFNSNNNTYMRSTGSYTTAWHGFTYMKTSTFKDDTYSTIGSWTPNLAAITLLNATGTVESCTFRSCHALIPGAGIFSFAPFGTLTVKGSTFTNLTSDVVGGAMVAVVKTFTVEETSISNCTATVACGGALLLSLQDKSTAYKTTFTKCKSLYAGGAFIFSFGQIEMKGCGFSECEATEYCAGAYIANFDIKAYLQNLIDTAKGYLTYIPGVSADQLDSLLDIVLATSRSNEEEKKGGSLELSYCYFTKNTAPNSKGSDVMVADAAGLASPPTLTKCYTDNTDSEAASLGDGATTSLTYDNDPKGRAEKELKEEEDKKNLITIILSVVAAVVVIVLIVLCCYCCCCRKKKQSNEEKHSTQEMAQA